MKPLILCLLALLGRTAAQTVTSNDVPAAPGPHDPPRSPFLSTTLAAALTAGADDDGTAFDAARQAVFADALTRFLAKVFRDQQVYAVTIVGVHVFDDHVLAEGAAAAVPRGPRTRSFTTVVSAEYTREDEFGRIADADFRRMLIHVCDKFQDHLLEFLAATGDRYLRHVDRVFLGDFERRPGAVAAGHAEAAEATTAWGLSVAALNTASIVAIVVGGIVFVALSWASVGYYRKEKQLRTRRQMHKSVGALLECADSPETTIHFVGDYSFEPLGSIPETDRAPPYTGDGHEPVRDAPLDDDVLSSVWPRSPPSTLFPAPVSTAVVAAAPQQLSYTEELKRLPTQHVFAPPGKIGVAIDVVNGQPVVHKIRQNSPLENMLRPNDIIVAIDDEDASCLSAADVTRLMVRRMDRVRKISFVRHE